MRLFQVDAFTAEPFAGNPAAVCLLEDVRGQAVDDRWMQAVAAEMNLPETAFLERRDDGNYDLRWFTPTVEVDQCGHATLASAHVLWEVGEGSDQLAFYTRSGVLLAERAADGRSIRLDFPAEPASEVAGPGGLLEALGVDARWVGQNRFDYVVEVADAATVRGVVPDLGRLRRFPVRGVVVTATSDMDGVDFVSRFFAPATGIDEDPVTGSAHCCLAPYWAERLGRTRLTGYQASPRGGTVGVEVAGDRVYLYGEAVTVLRGELAAG